MSSKVIQLRDAQLSIEDGIAEFTHTKPAARNALSLDLRQDYADMLDAVQGDRSVRALIITGSGGSFCAGGDIRSLKARMGSDDPELNSPDAMRRRLQAVHVFLERLRGLEMPVIAAVDGPAYGAGFAIALVADFVLASSRAAFCMSFAKVGLVPDSGVFYTLPRVVGMQKAKELMFTARRVGVEEAQQLGIVHSVYAPEALADEARRFARNFLNAPREVLALSKSLLNKSFETPYATLAELESSAQAVVSETPYHKEAVSAFLNGAPSRYDWDRDSKA
ncbi:4-chlorobenzoyl coenzyme A dehalogenase [compost metagenome]